MTLSLRWRWRMWRFEMRREWRMLLRGWVVFHVPTRYGWPLYQDRVWRMPLVFFRYLFAWLAWLAGRAR